MFWRLGVVNELSTGKDGITRAAIVKTVNSDRPKFFRRGIKHLIQIELNMNIKEFNSHNEIDNTDPVGADKRSHSTGDY